MGVDLKILIIDDDKIDSITISRSILQSGIKAEVDSIFSAKEGIEKIKSFQYDLIFLDYMMPDTDGISFLKKIIDLDIDTPVIFVTSQGDEKIASQAILNGAFDYIPKTLLTPDGVSQSIRNTLKLHKNLQSRKITELALKINSNRLIEAQKLAKIASWEINLNDNSAYFSDQFYSIFEVENEINTSVDFFKSFFNTAEDLSLFENYLKMTKSSQLEIQFNHAVTTKKGTVKFINQYIKCLYDEKDRPTKILGTIQDISEQKHIESELIKAKELAEQAVIIKEQFLTNMSHEIRTPMNGIIGFAKILENTILDDNQKQSVEAIKIASINLMNIINDILDFSKIEANKMTFEEISFSISETIKTIIQLLTQSAKDKKIKLLYQIDPKINDFLLGDAVKLYQVLINLIGNAIKFTEKGYVELVVTQVFKTDLISSLNFSVIDSGIGIPKNKLASIFDSFNQASNETTRKYGGTGLGLTITKKLIELQGGSIDVKSSVSEGSEFSFSLEYKNLKNRNKKQKLNLNPIRSADFLKTKKILLVEDNELNQLLTIKVFEKWNKEIDIAANGKIAIDKIKENSYDIILMDIQMPEMDGIELTKYIRSEMGQKSLIPIIALTAHATMGEEEKCIEVGMNDYLSKPFNFDILLDKLYIHLINNDLYNLDTTEMQSEEEQALKLFDLEYLKKFSADDDTFIKKMITMFITNTPESLNIILQSSKNDEIMILKNEIHKFKSSLNLLGMSKAVECVNKIEKQIKLNPNDDKIKTEITVLNEICTSALVQLNLKLKNY
ncbi:signal transduction histidine kinase/DNA-binding response OmpR family regulator [Flavobacterium sp. PL11]|uniref:response regulator n=1 Tax=Flavobacterium sp. PL11 TaxID=3071717 RepID=UPI002DF8664F|nr:signal transduction histidine kinase/DNA-binding response OmpR family regulator [Flavobacterium sp. PL11]